MKSLLLTIAEAAEEVRMSQSFIKREIRSGKLKAVKCGRHTRVRYCDLEAWSESLPERKTEGTSSGQDRVQSKNAFIQVVEKTVRARS